ncbi:MAG: beta-lactamase family protein, partial [Anaerolineae bacterium]|nr:beta-lactamase family protein [Anaerolineae bacterium]
MFPIPSFQNPDRSRLSAAFPKVDALFREFAEKTPVPGLAYGIVVDGELVSSGGMGIQNVDNKTPVTVDT